VPTVARLLEDFEERSWDFRGTRLRGLVAGPADGGALVLLHGLGGAGSNWALLAPELSRRRRVLVLDLPGHGGSSPLPAAPGLGPYADAVAAVVEHEQLAAVDLVGHSFGGLVSIRLAVRRPELVRGLVLVAAAGISSSTRWAERVLAFLGWVQPGRKLSPYWRAVAASDVLKRSVFAHWMTDDPGELSAVAVEALLRDVNLHTDTDSAWRAMTQDDPRADLHRVRAPALVLWGANDNQLPLEDAFDFARRLHAPVRVIAKCGHLLIVERPDACLDAIEGFLAALESRRAARGGPSHRGAEI
jgi:pimeloyl-ACP methyl ester carboxylesterase